MATMNFSVPDDVKDSFNQTFANENKSAHPPVAGSRRTGRPKWPACWRAACRPPQLPTSTT